MANENESKAKRINTETELQLLERSFGEWIGELRSSKILSPQQRRVMVWLLTSINIFNAEAAQNTLLTCQYLESSLCPNSSQHCIASASYLEDCGPSCSCGGTFFKVGVNKCTSIKTMENFSSTFYLNNIPNTICVA